MLQFLYEILLFLSDAALIMIKSGKSLNALYSKMVHLICATYDLYRVTEEVRLQFETIDKIVENVKKKYLKKHRLVHKFSKITDQTSLYHKNPL